MFGGIFISLLLYFPFVFCLWISFLFKWISKRNFIYKTSFNPIRLHLRENDPKNQGFSLPPDPAIKWTWVHVSSLGEYKTIEPLIVERTKQQNKKILLTYFNQDIDIYLQESLSDRSLKERTKNLSAFFFLPLENVIAYQNILAYYPIEEYWAVEGEFWPLLFWTLKKRQIKMTLFNAPFFSREWRMYSLFKFIYKPMLDCFARIYPTSQDFYERFLKFGIAEKKLYLMHNLKYHNPIFKAFTFPTQKKSQKRKVILINSIHRQEIKSLLPILLQSELGYDLLIAPRYLQEIVYFENFFKKQQIHCHKITAGEVSTLAQILSPSKKENHPSILPNVVLVNGYGFLDELYPLSDIVIIGGSFYPLGGHNPLEALAYGKPVLLGKYFEHFSDIVDDFKDYIKIMPLDKKMDPKIQAIEFKKKIARFEQDPLLKNPLEKIQTIVKKQPLIQLLG